jgi:hypothetical protein
VAYLLTERIVEVEKQPLLVNGPYTRSREMLRLRLHHAKIEEVIEAVFSVGRAALVATQL